MQFCLVDWSPTLHICAHFKLNSSFGSATRTKPTFSLHPSHRSVFGCVITMLALALSVLGMQSGSCILSSHYVPKPPSDRLLLRLGSLLPSDGLWESHRVRLVLRYRNAHPRHGQFRVHVGRTLSSSSVHAFRGTPKPFRMKIINLPASWFIFFTASMAIIQLLQASLSLATFVIHFQLKLASSYRPLYYILNLQVVSASSLLRWTMSPS